MHTYTCQSLLWSGLYICIYIYMSCMQPGAWCRYALGIGTWPQLMTESEQTDSSCPSGSVTDKKYQHWYTSPIPRGLCLGHGAPEFTVAFNSSLPFSHRAIFSRGCSLVRTTDTLCFIITLKKYMWMCSILVIYFSQISNHLEEKIITVCIVYTDLFMQESEDDMLRPACGWI